MSRENTLVKNTAILTIGKICTQLITFFLLPLYTGILSTEEYGTVDLLNTLVSLLLPIVTFQVEQAVFRNLLDVREDEREKEKIISTGFFSVIIQCIIYLIFFSIISPLIHNKYKIFLATNVIAYIFASLFQQIARGLGDNKQFAIGSFISALITILINILLLVFIKLGATGMLMGTMLGQISCTIYLFIILKLYKYIKIATFEYIVLKKLWKYSIPLIPNSISWWIFNASDRLIVSAVLGVGKNGILSAAHKFSTVYITFYNIFNMSWTEMVSIHINDSDIKEFFNKLFNIVLKIFTTIAIGIIACMPFVYKIMINERYYEGFYQVPIMMIGAIFSVIVSTLGGLYAAKRNTKAVANTSLISAIINIVVHITLINFIGLYAATISTFSAYFIMSIYRLHDVKKRYFKVTIEKVFIIKTLISLLIILPIYYIENIILNFIAIIVMVIYAIDINKNSIESIIEIAKDKFKIIKK